VRVRQTASGRDKGYLLVLGELLLLALGPACGSSTREKERAQAIARAAERAAQRPAGSSRLDPAGSPEAAAATAAAASAASPAPADDAAIGPPPPGEPADLSALKARILQGDTSSRAVKSLQALGGKYAKNQEIPYLLGQLYFEKLWVGDGIKNFRRAIQLDPLFRSNAYVIRAAISGLGNDRDHAQVRRFLVQDIGQPASPYLQEVLYGDWRQQVKERAAAILRELN
jgi:serine/threonine-protein kinase